MLYYPDLTSKAFITYTRSVFWHSNKEIFNVEALPFVEFGRSMGLPSTPNIKFKKVQKRDKEAIQQDLEQKLKMEEEREKQEELEEKGIKVQKVIN
jgi:ATP-dependent RNA helicase DDX10/DBP4